MTSDIRHPTSIRLPTTTTTTTNRNEQSEVSALAWLAQHKDAGALSPADREKERTAASARYYLQRDDVFLEDLPALGQGAGGGAGGGVGAASSFADTRERKEDPVGVVRESWL